MNDSKYYRKYSVGPTMGRGGNHGVPPHPDITHSPYFFPSLPWFVIISGTTTVGITMFVKLYINGKKQNKVT